MHLKRILSAIIAIPCLYLLILKGGPLSFTILVAVAGVIALGEYYRIVFNPQQLPVVGLIPGIGYLATSGIILLSYFRPGQFELVAGILVLNFLLAGIAALFQFKDQPLIVEMVTKQVHGVIYVAVLISSLVLLRGTTSVGISWIFFTLAIVALCDTGAYYAGTYLGKHKLCPSVSPGKTIEGFIGGLVFVMVAGLLVRHWFFPDYGVAMMILFLVIVSIVGPCGDLFESVLKRTGGIKDSGSIIPGHGGILDRIDALLFVAPVAYVFKTYVFI